MVRDTGVPVERVLARLADNPDVADLLRAFPELSREDVQSVLAYAHAKVAGSPAVERPQAFYREATRREDVRRILAALAK
jgi:hypothetical protein